MGQGPSVATGWPPLVCKIKSMCLTLALRPCLVCPHLHGLPLFLDTLPPLSPSPVLPGPALAHSLQTPGLMSHVWHVRASCEGSPVSYVPKFTFKSGCLFSPAAGTHPRAPFPGCSSVCPTWVIVASCRPPCPCVSWPSPALHSGCQGPWPKQVIDHLGFPTVSRVKAVVSRSSIT